MNASLRSKTEALAQRYGDAAPPEAGPWNDQIASLLAHRSIRGYRPDTLPDGTLETLVAAAQSAATSSNLQAWSVVAVTDAKTRSSLADIAGGQKHVEQCPLFLVWLADLSRHQRLGEAADVDMDGLPYVESFLVAAIDTALAAQNAVVAAESLGLSTVYIGAMRNDPVKVAEILGLPPRCVALFGLCVGYAAEGVTNQVKPRLPQPAVLFRERYGEAGEADLRAVYDTHMTAFSERHGMGTQSWSARVIGRMSTVGAMKGREKLSEILAALGFPLR